jgi:Asp-tRNA(Asn)/Glu-tRNA(Gln) amidotransferase A subunit family amidase
VTQNWTFKAYLQKPRICHSFIPATAADYRSEHARCIATRQQHEIVRAQLEHEFDRQNANQAGLLLKQLPSLPVGKEGVHLADMLSMLLAAVLSTTGTRPFTDIDTFERELTSEHSSCAATVQDYLNRIRVYDRPSGLNAISVVAPDTPAQVDAIQRRSAQTLPLRCVTVLVKDNIDVAGMATTAGSVTLAGNIAPDDAVVIRRLRAAGAIVLAHTNMAEWAFSPRHTVSSTVGETANAYDRARVPAGSSGGTASGIAAGFGLAGLGSDTGNSIRGPAARSGLVGMRPTVGLVPLDGVVPLLARFDVVGPITRSVADNARLLAVIAGPDPSDPATAHAVVGNYLAALKPGGLKGAHLGLLRRLAQPADMSPDVAALFDRAVADLAAAGATVTEVDVPDLMTLADTGYCASFRADVDAYLATIPGAPLRDVADAYRSGRFAPDTRDQFAFFLKNGRADCPPFARDPARQAFRAAVLDAMARAGVTALVYPTWTSGPALRTRWNRDYRGDNSQVVAPGAGLPAITVPMGFDRDGLPAGLQILGRPYAEAELYGLAYDYEGRTRHYRPPADFPPLP